MSKKESSLALLAKALIVTAEIMGSELSPIAAEAMARDLSRYPPSSVSAALERCRREVKGRLSLADIIARIDDGHLGPEQAWALAQQARDESVTVVWTEEIAEAFGAARPLLAAGDDVAARMAFREVYTRLVQNARNAGQPAKYMPSYGTDARQRVVAVKNAVEHGRLASEYKETLALPSGDDDRTLPMTEISKLLTSLRKKGTGK